MALENGQFITIDEAIYDYLNESEQSNHKYRKLWYIAYNGVTEMGLDSFFCVKSVKLPVLPNLTVKLPGDFRQYSKIGVLNQQGQIIPLSVNNTLTTAFDLSPDRLTQTEDNSIQTQLNQQGVWWYNYWNGQAFGPVYGIPSGSPFVGSFKIDNANKVIVLSQNFNYDYVMLEYVAAPEPDNQYCIPVQFKQALICYLGWKDIRFIPSKTHVQNSNVNMRREDFYNELEKAKARYDPVRIPDLYEWNLQNQRLSVKS